MPPEIRVGFSSFLFVLPGESRGHDESSSLLDFLSSFHNFLGRNLSTSASEPASVF